MDLVSISEFAKRLQVDRKLVVSELDNGLIKLFDGGKGSRRLIDADTETVKMVRGNWTAQQRHLKRLEELGEPPPADMEILEDPRKAANKTRAKEEAAAAALETVAKLQTLRKQKKPIGEFAASVDTDQLLQDIEDIDQTNESFDMSDIKRLNELVKLKREATKLRELNGEFYEREKTDEAWFAAGVALRKRLIGIAQRLGPMFAGETDGRKCTKLLKDEMEKACELFAKDFGHE